MQPPTTTRPAPPSRPDKRSRRRRHLVGGGLALALVTGAVLQTSAAVFTATTSNEGNSVSVGSVFLTDDDAGNVAFTLSNVAPGQSEERCIEVIYTGTLDPSEVRLYTAVAAEVDAGTVTPDGGDLATHVNVVIQRGTGAVADGTFDCTGFTSAATIQASTDLDTFDTAHSSYADGLATGFDPVNTNDEATFRIELTLDAATPNGEQGDALNDIDIFWEVQS